MMKAEKAYRAVEWRSVFLVATMCAVSFALVETGLAKRAGALVLTLVRPYGGLAWRRAFIC